MKHRFSGSYLIHGTAFTQHLAVEDGVYLSEKGQITGLIRMGIKTGSFTLTVESSAALGDD